MGDKLRDLARRLGEGLSKRRLVLACAESCTGGWVAKTVTDIPGSSAWFDRGFVTYTNEAKRQMLGVRAETLERQGAVSVETVREMAEGALMHSGADLALAISGVAGPGGGSEEKPVGTVCFAWSARDGGTRARCKRFNGNREAVRRKSVAYALEKMLKVMDGKR